MKKVEQLVDVVKEQVDLVKEQTLIQDLHMKRAVAVDVLDAKWAHVTLACQFLPNVVIVAAGLLIK
ncbi:hypothetical protein [Paenibacillus polymyxa]|uniref:hypothetical protein n=1 Tax=Paenibacillus polymyxa TaxID=1406 RepID=UPI00237A05E4|nr:hypothetical protein [Paenibacillus polymyxa]WDM20589.1 hypothetical protein J4I02_16280 [Paenibacillus polymyxa]